MKNLERFPGYRATWAIHHLKVYKDRKYIVGDEEQIGNLNRTLNLHPLNFLRRKGGETECK